MAFIQNSMHGDLVMIWPQNMMELKRTSLFDELINGCRSWQSLSFSGGSLVRSGQQTGFACPNQRRSVAKLQRRMMQTFGKNKGKEKAPVNAAQKSQRKKQTPSPPSVFDRPRCRSTQSPSCVFENMDVQPKSCSPSSTSRPLRLPALRKTHEGRCFHRKKGSWVETT